MDAHEMTSDNATFANIRVDYGIMEKLAVVRTFFMVPKIYPTGN